MPYIVIEDARPMSDAAGGNKHEMVPAGTVFRAVESYWTTDGDLWVRADMYGTKDYPQVWFKFIDGARKDADGHWDPDTGQVAQVKRYYPTVEDEPDDSDLPDDIFDGIDMADVPETVLAALVVLIKFAWSLKPR